MISIFNKVTDALIKSSNKISGGIEQIFLKRKLDEQTLTELEELLISADIGGKIAGQFIDELKAIKFDKEVKAEVIKEKLAQAILKPLLASYKPFILPPVGLSIILVCGVNGTGKTTTIGKLAADYIAQGKKVAIAACDTFRAAAVEQLAKWAAKAGALLITGEEKADPSSVAYNAMLQAAENNIDILFIDTAGRLHNYKNLMDELSKIIRVIKKINPAAPHYSMLVLDATTGQNAKTQVEQFSAVAAINSLVITKLDGTAKAGVVVGITQNYNLPVHFIGVGEKVSDIKPFNPEEFAKALVGI